VFAQHNMMITTMESLNAGPLCKCCCCNKAAKNFCIPSVEFLQVGLYFLEYPVPGYVRRV